MPLHPDRQASFMGDPHAVSESGYLMFAGNPEVLAIASHEHLVTYTPIEQYIRFGAIPPNWEEEYPHRQVVEVATGLSEFLPTLAHIADIPPIAIDPLDYRVMIELVQRAQRDLPLTQTQEAIAETLIARAQTMLDPSLVQHIPLTLKDAIAEHPELKGIADVDVIDVAGTQIYESNPGWANRMEQHYLKKQSRGQAFDLSRILDLFTP